MLLSEHHCPIVQLASRKSCFALGDTTPWLPPVSPLPSLIALAHGLHFLTLNLFLSSCLQATAHAVPASGTAFSQAQSRSSPSGADPPPVISPSFPFSHLSCGLYVLPSILVTDLHLLNVTPNSLRQNHAPPICVLGQQGLFKS